MYIWHTVWKPSDILVDYFDNQKLNENIWHDKKLTERGFYLQRRFWKKGFTEKFQIVLRHSIAVTYKELLSETVTKT